MPAAAGYTALERGSEAGDTERPGDAARKPTTSPGPGPGLGIASMFSCVVALVNTILGSGMLGLPSAFAACGYLLGTFLLCLSAATSAFGLHLLAVSADTIWRQEGEPRTPTTFYRVAYVGLRRWAFLIDVAVSIKCFGVGCSYLIVIGDLMPEAMEQIFPATEFVHGRIFWVLCGWSVVAPLSFMPTLDKLKVTNNLALVCVAIVTGITFAYALATLGLLGAIGEPGGALAPCADDNPDCVGDRSLLVLSGDTARKLTVFVFAFTCAQNIFPICNELQDFSLQRVDRVILSSIGTGFGVFTVVAFSGYITYGSAVASDILVTFPQTPLLSMARILISLLVAFSYPLQCLPARNSVTTLWTVLCAQCGCTQLQSDPRLQLPTLGGGGGGKRERQSRQARQGARNGFEAVDSDDHEGDEQQPSLTVTVLPLDRGADDDDDDDAAPPLLVDVTKTGGGFLASMRCRCCGGSLDGGDGMTLHVVLTTAYLLGSLGVALLFDDLGIILSIVGATGSTIVSYILPGAIYWSIHPPSGGGGDPCSPTRALAGLLFGAGCVIIPVALSFIFVGS